MIGDKPRWYSHYLEPVYYQVHNPHSQLGHDLLDDSDDSGPLYDDEDELTDSDISLDDDEYLQLSKERTLSVDLDVTTKAREVGMISVTLTYCGDFTGFPSGLVKGKRYRHDFHEIRLLVAIFSCLGIQQRFRFLSGLGKK